MTTAAGRSGVSYGDELVLALGRVLLAVAAVADLSGHTGLPARLVSAYVLPAAVLAAAVWWRREPLGQRLRWVVHALDLAWAAGICGVGLGKLGYAALAFVVFAAGHRWGARHALWTALAAAALSAPVFAREIAADQPNGAGFVLAEGTLALVGLLAVGWLASEQRRARARGDAFMRAFTRTLAAHGLEGALGAALRETRAVFEASDAVLLLRDVEAGRDLLWSLSETGRARPTELASGEREIWLVADAADAWHAERQGAGRWKLDALDAGGRPLRDAPEPPVDRLERLAALRSATRLTAVAFRAPGEWDGRLLLFDARLAWPRVDALRLGQRLVRELGGVVFARYLAGRVRGRVGALERARIARELHDGTIQSLVGIEMQIDVLRRQVEDAGSPLAAELARVQRLLRNEVLDVRDSMERLRAPEVDPPHLVGYLDEMVARFQRDTGMRALFDSHAEDVDLPPAVCRELARVVREALHNIRKHSGARHVVVRLRHDPDGWRLVVDDDGRGFPFSGHLSHAQLDSERKGPYVIKERVRALGGQLSIDTAPGGGARLEIFLPREAA